MTLVTLNNVAKSFGNVDVIHRLSLEIGSGEFVALVGPSGCGKSTLLRMIAGLEDISGGEVEINGRVVNALTPRERNIAMVFQSYALYPHMTVAQNMGFNLKLSGTPKSELDARVAEAARMLDLTELLDRKPSQLSGGQRQRVAMGRAVVRKPSVFLFDEPLSNLDAKLRVQMRAEIKHLHKRVQTTALYVTHDQIEAMTLADRVVVLNKGNIEQVGTPLELYTRPRNLFVAGFIGSPAMNFLEAVVKVRDGKLFASIRDGAELLLDNGLDLKDDQKVLLGLRPEHLTLGSGQNQLNGTITLVEPTGAQTHVAFEFAGKQLTAVLDGMTTFNYGEPLVTHVDPQNIHVFDHASGIAARA